VAGIEAGRLKKKELHYRKNYSFNLVMTKGWKGFPRMEQGRSDELQACFGWTIRPADYIRIRE
jgi:hypothetical protein